jgi:hypothetical protein
VNWKSTGEKTGGVGRASKLLSDNSPVDFATPGEYFAEKPDKENECDFFFIHPVNWKSTGEKTGGVVSEPRFFIKPRIGIRCTRKKK